jgi:hypothetical protein
MRRALLHHPISVVLGFALLAVPATLRGQQPTTPQATPPVSEEQLTTYAKAFTAISQLLEQIQPELAQSRNKTAEAQKQLRDNLRAGTAKILKDNSLTDEQYARITYLISTDPERRKAFEEILAKIAPKDKSL